MELLNSREFRTESNIYNDFLSKCRRIERELSDIFINNDTKMFPSIKYSNLYFYLLYFYTVDSPYRMKFKNHPESYISYGKNITKEPYVEIIESDNAVSITVELPEVSKENIDLEIIQNILLISVNQEEIRYYKTLELPFQINAESAITSFQNGLLDIEFKKGKSSIKKQNKVEKI
jgi:HSP20 family molecular chaperone IbpA